MSDIGKTFRNWQQQDINRLKNIREKHEKEDNIIWKCFLIGVVIFIVFILCYV
jgi:hypothetical protein